MLDQCEPKVVPIIAGPRTGSNLLVHLLSSQSDSLGLFEIFHHKELMPDLAGLLIRSYGSHERYWQAAQTDPMGVLWKILASLGVNAEVVFLKVFPSHLRPSALSQLLRASTGCIALTRNPLSSWISAQLAERTGKYTNLDTTDLQVEFNPKNFAHWGLWQLDFMEAAVAESERLGIPCVSVTYRDLLDYSKLPESFWAKIRRTIPELPQYTPRPDFVVPIRRQDNRSPIERLDVTSEARQILLGSGLGKLVKEDMSLPSQELRAGLQNLLLQLS